MENYHDKKKIYDCAQEQGRKAESTESSHIAGVIAVDCDLLCGQTKQVLPVKKFTASPLRISPVFPPSSIHL